MLDTVLSTIGIDLHDFVAGCMGGIAVSFALKKSDPWDIIGSIIGGALVGNYVPSAGDIFHIPHGFSAFGTGVIAMPLCQYLVLLARKKLNGYPPGT